MAAEMTREQMADLTRRLQQGDANAWGEFVNGFRARAVRYFRVNGCAVHRADDLAQDAFLRAYAGIGGLRNGTSLLPWFDAIVRRLWLDQRAAAKPPPAQADMAAMAFNRQPSNEDVAEPSKRPWDELKPDDRELLMLRYVGELTEREIAELMDLTSVVVKLRLQRIRQKLRAGERAGESDAEQEKS